MDYAEPQFESEFQNEALEDWLLALISAAADERDPVGRRDKAARAAQVADRILATLPDDLDSCRFAGVAVLRWLGVLAQAHRCAFGSNPDLAGAKALFDIVQVETGDTDNVAKERVRTALRDAGVDV
jgi:hypothetical protein